MANFEENHHIHVELQDLTEQKLQQDSLPDQTAEIEEGVREQPIDVPEQDNPNGDPPKQGEGESGEAAEEGETEKKYKCACPFTIYVKLLQFFVVIAIGVLQFQLFLSVKDMADLGDEIPGKYAFLRWQYLQTRAQYQRSCGASFDAARHCNSVYRGTLIHHTGTCFRFFEEMVDDYLDNLHKCGNVSMSVFYPEDTAEAEAVVDYTRNFVERDFNIFVGFDRVDNDDNPTFVSNDNRVLLDETNELWDIVSGVSSSNSNRYQLCLSYQHFSFFTQSQIRLRDRTDDWRNQYVCSVRM